jgi:hypothetical protein
VHDVLRSPGQRLDAATRSFFEPRFGHDFSKVRIHADGKAAESAQAVNSLAYTVGRDIVLGAGQYQPSSQSINRLLAHELTHVVQQSAASSAFDALEVGGTDTPQEREADRMAQAAVQRQLAARPTSQRATLLQRDPLPGPNTPNRPLTCGEMCGDNSCQPQIGERQCTPAQTSATTSSWALDSPKLGNAIKNFEDGYTPPMTPAATARLDLALKKNFNWSPGDAPTNLKDIVHGKLTSARTKFGDLLCPHCGDCPSGVVSYVVFDSKKKACLDHANCFGLCPTFNATDGPHALMHELFHRVTPPPAPGGQEDYLNGGQYTGTAVRASIQADTYASLVDDLSAAAPAPGPSK